VVTYTPKPHPPLPVKVPATLSVRTKLAPEPVWTLWRKTVYYYLQWNSGSKID